MPLTNTWGARQVVDHRHRQSLWDAEATQYQDKAKALAGGRGGATSYADFEAIEKLAGVSDPGAPD